MTSAAFFVSDQARQTRRTAPRGNKAERCFRQTDFGRWIIRCHAVVARERDLISAARARAVNRRTRRNLERGEAIKNALAFGDERAHFAGLRLTQQRVRDRRRR